MPDPQPERRRGGSGGQPTQLLVAYNSLCLADKRRFSWLGFSMIVFFGAFPMIGQLVLKALALPGIGWPYWMFSGVGLLIGLLLLWPPAGIYALSAIPAGIAKILPKGLRLDRVDRRNDEGDER